jgi:hypothetical protein
VSLDAFQRRDPRPPEAAAFRRVMRGWACASLERFDRYAELAGEVGLKVVEAGDVTARAAPSARIIRRRHVPLYPLACLARAAGLAPPELVWHFQAAMAQRDLYCRPDGLLMFGYLVAAKPLWPDGAAGG